MHLWCNFRSCTLGIRIKMLSRHLLPQNTVVLKLNWSRILRWAFQIKLQNFLKWTPLERWDNLVWKKSVIMCVCQSCLNKFFYVMCRFLYWKHLMVLSLRAMPLHAMVRLDFNLYVFVYSNCEYLNFIVCNYLLQLLAWRLIILFLDLHWLNM